MTECLSVYKEKFVDWNSNHKNKSQTLCVDILNIFVNMSLLKRKELKSKTTSNQDKDLEILEEGKFN